MSQRLATTRAGLRRRAETVRRAVARTGPWPAARSVRAVAALAVAAAVARWAVTAEPALGGLFEFPAVAGLGVLAAGLVLGRTRLLGAAVVLLTLAVGLAVAAASPSAGTAAGLGAALVVVLELSRWSIERRVDMASEDATERRRWLHLAGVLALGWLLGASAVAVAAGRLGGSLWQLAVAALAAVAIAAVVVAAARSQA